MSINPYQIVMQKKHQRQGNRMMRALMRALLVVAVILLLRTPLAAYVTEIDGLTRLEQLIFRTAAVLVSISALQTYTDVVRHPERSIFGTHPVRSRLLLWVLIREHIISSLMWLLMAIGLWSGLQLDQWIWSALYLTAAWFGGIGTGYGVHLGSVWAAQAPSMSGILNALRGQNPKAQAAFIYAPGFALGLVGMSLIAGAGALRITIGGQTGWAWMIFLPIVMGLGGFFTALKLAPNYLVRAGMVLIDIDSHWGIVDGEEEEQSVYLEWTANSRPHRLRLLRQAWRFHRWVTIGLWASGCLVAMGLWVQQTWSAVIAMGIVSTMYMFFPSRLSESDPAWLAESLGVSLTVQQRAWWDVSVILFSSFWVPIVGTLLLGMHWDVLIQIMSRLIATIGVLYWLSCGLRTSRSVWSALVGVATSLTIWGSWLMFMGSVQ